MTMNRRTTLATAVTLVLAALSPAAAQEKVVLHGASQFNESHAFNKTMARFAELVKQYYGKPSSS
jgi:TRAP-type C4-dicarboxylate transport system substrate-binding protein